MRRVTDDDCREVARRLRSLDDSELQVYDMTYFAIQRAVGGGGDQHPDGRELADRLADLIEPVDGFDLDTVQRVCFECMEGCDEPEWTLYTTIYSAIARYKRGESGPTYDRDALLALAEEMNRDGKMQRERQKSGEHWFIDGLDVREYARRIREALGVTS